MSKKPPDTPVVYEPAPKGGSGSEDRDTKYEIGSLHLHTNEIDAIRRLSEENPDLADKLVSQRDRIDHRENFSFRFGMVIAVVFVGMVLGWIYLMFSGLGILQSFLSIGMMLGASFLVVSIVKGEWSETSWMGQIVNGLIKLLGGDKRDDRDGGDPPI